MPNIVCHQLRFKFHWLYVILLVSQAYIHRVHSSGTQSVLAGKSQWQKFEEASQVTPTFRKQKQSRGSSSHLINFLPFIWSRTPIIGKVLAPWEGFFHHDTYQKVSSQTCTEFRPLGSDYPVKLTTNIRIHIY